MSEDRPEVRILLCIEQEIHNGTVRVYRDALGRAFINCETPEFPLLLLPLGHHDVRGWISHFAWIKEQILLQRRQLDRMLEFLRGFSLTNQTLGMSDPSMLELLETNVFLALIVEFMEGKASLEFSMNELLKRLKSFAKDQGLMARVAAKLPGGPNILSRRLSELEPQLKQFGITVTIRRSNGAKVILTGRKDNSTNPSSVGSSTANGLSQKEINPVDEKKRRIEELKRRQQGSQNSNSQNGGFTS